MILLTERTKFTRRRCVNIYGLVAIFTIIFTVIVNIPVKFNGDLCYPESSATGRKNGEVSSCVDLRWPVKLYQRHMKLIN